MSLPYLTKVDPVMDDTCPRCEERGGMAIVVIAFGVIFALGVGLLAGAKIGYQVGKAEQVAR